MNSVMITTGAPIAPIAPIASKNLSLKIKSSFNKFKEKKDKNGNDHIK